MTRHLLKTVLHSSSHLWPLLIATACTLVVTWPLAITNQLPLGQEPVATVPQFNAWTIWWNLQQPSQLWANYWNAPIFYPAKNAFALSEPQPLTVLLLPLWLGTKSLLLCYKVWLLTGVTLNGYFGWRLLRACRIQPVVAICFIPLFVCLPMVHWLLGVLQLVSVWSMLWACTELVHLRRRPRYIRGVRFGIAWGLTWLLCEYYGLILSIGLVAVLPVVLGRRLREKRCLGTLVVSGCCGLAVAGLFLSSHLARIPAADNVEHILAPARAFFMSPWTMFEPSNRWAVGVGTTVTVAAGLAVLLQLFGGKCPGRSQTRFVWAFSALAAVGVVFAAAETGGLVEFIPGVSMARNQFRFAVLWQIGGLVLAAIAVNAIGRWLASRGYLKVACTGLVIFLGLAMLELWPAGGHFADVPYPERTSGGASLMQRLRAIPAGSTLLILPIQREDRVADFRQTTAWMYQQQWHGLTLANGYSGGIPAPSQSLFNEVRKLKSPVHPAAELIRYLAESGIDYVVYPNGGVYRIQSTSSGR